MLALYRRSVEKCGLRYIPYIGDGDSKGYSVIDKEKPYGPSVFIPKEECISHVTKRMGTNLRNLVKDFKGMYESVKLLNPCMLLSEYF